MSTTLEKLVLKYPNKPWDLGELTENDCITLQFIKDHPQLPWDYKQLSWNRNVTEEFIQQHPVLDTEVLCIVDNPNLSLDFLFKLCNGENYLSSNKWITLSFIDQYPEIQWDWTDISYNVPLQDIINHPDRNWSFSNVSQNPNLTEEFLEQNADKEWHWLYVSRHQNITLSFVQNHPEYPWDTDGLSWNPNLTLPFILDHPEKEWDWHGISINSGITQKDITKHPELPWRRCELIYNDNITHFNQIQCEDVDEYKRNCGKFCINPNITPEIIEKNIRYIDWYELSQNIFERDTYRYKSILSRKSIKIVQKWWRTTIKQRVFKELDDVISVTDLARFVIQF